MSILNVYNPILSAAANTTIDGNPIGTVISYMGLTAPKDYLVCDGAEYSISEYSQLANFFKKQFGSSNHFGGDGTTTFAVPDLRNLFLRGYHGEAEEQLSGDIGDKQEATLMPYVQAHQSSFFTTVIPGTTNEPREVDSLMTIDSGLFRNGSNGSNVTMEWPYQFTSRPVNAAVLYCIKAAASVPAENAYSTEEVRIGTWIDGKPVYRRVFNTQTGSAVNDVTIVVNDVQNVDYPVYISGIMNLNNRFYQIPDSYNDLSFDTSRNCIYHVIRSNAYIGFPLTIVLEYTKTTD